MQLLFALPQLLTALLLPLGTRGPPASVAYGGRRCALAMQMDADDLAGFGGFGDEGGKRDVDWDQELFALAKRDNRFLKAIKAISPPELIADFAQTAPREVQLAVKATIGQVLGNLPPEFAQTVITTTGKSLATLMFSMQMTGYMFRNAAYRKSLSESMGGGALEAAGAGTEAQALPPVKGKISVRRAGRSPRPSRARARASPAHAAAAAPPPTLPFLPPPR